MTGYSFDRFKSTYTKGIITTTIIINSENYAHNSPYSEINMCYLLFNEWIKIRIII